MRKANSLTKFLRLIYVLLIVVPTFAGFTYALLHSLGLTGLLTDGLTLKYWSEALRDFYMWKSIGFSFLIAVISVFLSFCIALFLVLKLTDDFQKKWFHRLLFLPLCFPATVMAFYVMQTFSKSGFLSRLSFQFGWIDHIESFPELTNDAYGIGIMLTSVLLVFPFFTLFLKNIFDAERLQDYGLIAQSLGAKPRHAFWKISLALLWQKSKSTVVLYIIFVMGSYEVPLLLGRQNPQMITPRIVDKAQRFNLHDIPQAYVMALIYLFLVLLLISLMSTRFVQFFKKKTHA
ncbi:MAG: sulfate ABC transporter permease [Psychroflexus sp.]|nr:sulfate ABC transporter permease [Psychroflexus sp.]MDN6309093.1 sulfate ABC transporter permease [Psychroflexus sp.]